MNRFRRPGRRPGSRRSGREALVLLVLGSGIGLMFLRSYANLSILQASQTVAKRERMVAALEREIDWERVEVERLSAPARIEPRARESGLERPPATSVMLLTARESPPFPGARPLGVPGAGALGRLFRRAATAATVPTASAALEEAAGRRFRGSPPPPPPPRSKQAAAAQKEGLTAGEHGGPGERGSRCQICRALAAGQSVGH